MREAWGGLRARYERFAQPSGDGLPRARVLLAFPVMLLILGAVLVGLGVNGSSSGAFYPEIASGSDPDLVAGQPQRIRSDEWNVGTVWTIAQVQQGLPEQNRTFPGGMDADLPYDLPHTGPSMIAKPHLWGFLFLDVDRAVAWKWWLPGLALLAAASMFAVTLLPRRPLLGAVLATSFFFSPFVQWWYQTSTLWPLVWGLLTMTAMLWGIRARRRIPRWGWSVAVAYFTVVMAMGVYAPFIIPVGYVVAFAAIGIVVGAVRGRMRVSELIARAAPVAVGGAVGIGVTLLWLHLKADTVDRFLSTVYPGERLAPTGGAGALGVAQLMSSSFSQALLGSGGFLGLNSSEASTFFFVGLLLIPVIIAFVIVRRRARAPLPWFAIGVVGVVALFALWLVVPGWDPVSHLLALDRTTPARLRIGLGLASFVLVVCVIEEAEHRRAGRRLAGILTGAFLLSQVAIAVAVAVVLEPGRLGKDAPLWWLVALVTGGAIFAFARGRALIGAVALLAVSFTATLGVHPLYRGVLDLRETVVAQTVIQLDDEDAEPWVGVGGSLVTAILLESGAEAFNGTQGAPSPEMWHEIDPGDTSEELWNRIGAVRWEPGQGEPTITNPAPDVILATFDACSDFAQQNVGRVLSDTGLTSPCLERRYTFRLPKYTLTVYDVVPGP